MDSLTTFETQRRLTHHDVVVVSSRSQSLTSGAEAKPGEAHFSLHLSAKRFLHAFKHAGIKTFFVARPEIYGTDISRKILTGYADGFLHVAFGDYASLRLLKGAYNVAYVAWEYDAISGPQSSGKSLWKNQFWVLSLFDEIWVGATFVKSAFERSGLSNVHVVPAPVPLPSSHQGSVSPEDIIGAFPAVPLYLDFSSQEHAERQLANMTDQFLTFRYRRPLSEKRVTFLTIINPGDARKNSEASILGFAEFARDYPNAVLIVKLVSPDDIPLSKRLWRTLRIQLNRLVDDGIVSCENILFINEFLDEDDLLKLLGSVDFYLSTSFAEGLNLPVLEAMAAGAVVISPIHTAMKDYLSADNCVICKAIPFDVDGIDMTGYPIGRVTCYEASPSHVAQALRSSMALSEVERERLRKNARQTVVGRYDIASVAERINERISAVVSS